MSVFSSLLANIIFLTLLCVHSDFLPQLMLLLLFYFSFIFILLDAGRVIGVEVGREGGGDNLGEYQSGASAPSNLILWAQFIPVDKRVFFAPQFGLLRLFSCLFALLFLLLSLLLFRFTRHFAFYFLCSLFILKS